MLSCPQHICPTLLRSAETLQQRDDSVSRDVGTLMGGRQVARRT
jgi:hypothetical protein